MSQKERVIAGLLLAIAVLGVASIPRLLSAPVAPVGVAIGPGPSPSVVHAPAIPTRQRRAAPQQVSSPAQAAVPRIVPAKRVSLRPVPKQGAAHTQKVSPPPPPPTTAPLTPPASASAQPTSPQPSFLASASTRPGNGYGDKNHVHTGPSGHEPSTEQKREHGHDLRGSGDGRPLQQASPDSVGHGHRGVGRVAKAPARPAPPAAEARPKARSKAGGPRGKVRSAPPVAPEHGHHGSDKPKKG
jgi:hypothetical protein